MNRRGFVTGSAALGAGFGIQSACAAQDGFSTPETMASEANPYPTTQWCGDKCSSVWAERLFNRPIITPHMDDRMGDNINGPSLIRVPGWSTNKLGKYYLYFSHHRGDYIRMAYADHIEGPWKIYAPGVLPLDRSGFEGHIASPEVIVDEERRQFRLYYHGVIPGGRSQRTRVALSSDGLNFTSRGDVILDWYARIFRFDGYVYALCMPGVIFRSRDGLTQFEKGPSLFPGNARHSAVCVSDGKLKVFYSNRGDNPESILYREIDLSGNWMDWQAGPSKLILAPERTYEGASLPMAPSGLGPATSPVRQLRDPALFIEGDQTYLIYSVAGEMGLAAARVHAF